MAGGLVVELGALSSAAVWHECCSLQVETNEENVSRTCLLLLFISTAAKCIFYYPELYFHQYQLPVLHGDAAISLLTGCDHSCGRKGPGRLRL